MTTEDRVTAVAEFGFTQRQARFLVMVMRHAGVCLLRQYSAFAGIVPGQKTRAFFNKLVSRRFASSYACRHNRGRLYHVQHYPLYEAIGEPNSRYRRPVPAGRIAERLTLLDGVLANPELTWLATQVEKVTHFTTLPAVPVEKLPHLTMRTGSPPAGDPFPDRLPIGIDANGRAVFLYLVLPTARDDFRAFLGRHADLFRTLPAWTLRLVFPRSLAHAYGAFQAVVREELESPLHGHTVEELTWYFGQVGTLPNERLRWPSDERLERARWAFESPRFYGLYRRWLRDGDGALDSVSSPLISEALASGAGRLECLVLPHRYEHLSPLVALVGSTARGAEKGAEHVEQRGEQAPAPSRPLSGGTTHDVNGASFV